MKRWIILFIKCLLGFISIIFLTGVIPIIINEAYNRTGSYNINFKISEIINFYGVILGGVFVVITTAMNIKHNANTTQKSLKQNKDISKNELMLGHKNYRINEERLELERNLPLIVEIHKMNKEKILYTKNLLISIVTKTNDYYNEVYNYVNKINFDKDADRLYNAISGLETLPNSINLIEKSHREHLREELAFIDSYINQILEYSYTLREQLVNYIECKESKTRTESELPHFEHPQDINRLILLHLKIPSLNKEAEQIYNDMKKNTGNMKYFTQNSKALFIHIIDDATEKIEQLYDGSIPSELKSLNSFNKH